ncbi:MAG TPA: hypothetical protein VFV92_10355, partial [Candidatus Bathyarchaeia archaeon]|nr:hypothetical protein [Candidatus Bathyarchaeia archaeon]
SGLPQLTLVLLFVAAVFISSASVSQLLHQPDLTVDLLNSIAQTVLLLGIGGVILSMIMAEPGK